MCETIDVFEPFLPSGKDHILKAFNQGSVGV
jgi:hypothetical protein